MRIAFAALALSLLACGETKETLGVLTAREIKLGDDKSVAKLNASQLMLVDAEGRSAIISTEGIRFFSKKGVQTGEYTATADAPATATTSSAASPSPVKPNPFNSR